MDEKFAAVASHGSAVIATRLRHSAETSSCPLPTSPSCPSSWSPLPQPPPPPLPDYNSDTYIAWSENFTLSIEHGFNAHFNNKLNFFVGSSISGVLLDALRDPVFVCAVDFPSPAICVFGFAPPPPPCKITTFIHRYHAILTANV